VENLVDVANDPAEVVAKVFLEEVQRALRSRCGIVGSRDRGYFHNLRRSFSRTARRKARANGAP
jgi:hypothetical protein